MVSAQFAFKILRLNLLKKLTTVKLRFGTVKGKRYFITVVGRLTQGVPRTDDLYLQKAWVYHYDGSS